VAYRPMDQVEFSVVDAELQDAIKTLANALMEGVQKLARARAALGWDSSTHSGPSLASTKCTFVCQLLNKLTRRDTRVLGRPILLAYQPGEGHHIVRRCRIKCTCRTRRDDSVKGKVVVVAVSVATSVVRLLTWKQPCGKYWESRAFRSTSRSSAMFTAATSPLLRYAILRIRQPTLLENGEKTPGKTGG
jgi:hypothetical protein